MTDTYNFTPGFTQKLMAACCHNSTVYNRVGHMLDAEALVGKEAKMICVALKMVFDEVGSGPGDADIVFQRLRRINEDGHLCMDDFLACVDYIQDVESLPETNALINETANELRDRANTMAIETGFETLGAKDQQRTIDALLKAQRIGVEDASIGITLGTHIFDRIKSMRRMDRLPTGILSLDSRLMGGPSRGQLAFWVGGPGDGKSMALNTNAVVALRAGYQVAYATLELADLQCHTRALACLTGVPINEIETGQSTLCKERYIQLIEQGKIGAFHVKEFTPQATDPAELFAWCDTIEQKTGKPVDLLVVDYADKLRALNAKDEYNGALMVYEALRLWAHEHKRWLWTASQSTRKVRDQKMVDMMNIADSIHKARVADLIITLMHDGDSNMMDFFTAKNRTGESRFKVGPLPSAFELGSVIAGCAGAGIVDVHGNEYQSAIQAGEVLDVINDQIGGQKVG